MAPKARFIQAFFAGTCRACGCKVAKGESVWFAKHYGIRCEKCGPHTSSDQPLPSKRKAKSAKRGPVPMPMPAPKSARTRLPVPTDPSRLRDFVPLYAQAALRGEVCMGPDGVGRLSWSGLADAVEDALRDYAQNEDARVYLRDLHRTHQRTKWANNHTLDSLQKAVSEPDAMILNEITAMREELLGDVALPTRPRRKLRRGQDWGDELDPDRFLAREPSAWERFERESQSRRTVTIGVNLTVACGQTPDELLYRGAAAIALADLLTQRGVNVRVLGFSVGEDVSSNVRKLVSTLELKSADMPLDTASLATAVCDVGFYRMVVMPAEFRHLPGTVSKMLGTRGHQYLPGPDRMQIDYLVESCVTSRQAAVTWLREQLIQATENQEVAHV